MQKIMKLFAVITTLLFVISTSAMAQEGLLKTSHEMVQKWMNSKLLNPNDSITADENGNFSLTINGITTHLDQKDAVDQFLKWMSGQQSGQITKKNNEYFTGRGEILGTVGFIQGSLSPEVPTSSNAKTLNAPTEIEQPTSGLNTLGGAFWRAADKFVSTIGALTKNLCFAPGSLELPQATDSIRALVQIDKKLTLKEEILSKEFKLQELRNKLGNDNLPLSLDNQKKKQIEDRLKDRKLYVNDKDFTKRLLLLQTYYNRLALEGSIKTVENEGNTLLYQELFEQAEEDFKTMNSLKKDIKSLYHELNSGSHPGQSEMI